MGAPDSVLIFITGHGVFETMSVDSTHYRFNRYEMVDGARRGLVYQKMAIKQHILISPKGR